MGSVPLQSWTFAWLGVRFDTDRGRARLHIRPREIRGFAYRSQRRWYALWNDSGRICFQVGSGRWYADDGWAASVREDGAVRTFRLAKAGNAVVEHKYANPNLRWWNRLDTSFDELDELMSDFFLWAVKVWSDKESREDLIRRWRPAPKLRSVT